MHACLERVIGALGVNDVVAMLAVQLQQQMPLGRTAPDAAVSAPPPDKHAGALLSLGVGVTVLCEDDGHVEAVAGVDE